MSATGRSVAAGTGYERHPDDDFATPYWCTRAILPFLRFTDATKGAFDPCCGSGAILDVASERWKAKRGIEINHDRAMAARVKGHFVVRADTLTHPWPDVDVGITNPPYSLAMEIILRSMDLARRIDFAFLLRLNFLGSQKRAAFHKEHPADIYPLPKRPEFVLSVSCKKKKECGWGVTIPFLPTGVLSSPKPTACGQCDGPVVSSSSDATEYGWFVWGPGRGNRWFMLDVPGGS